MTDLTILTILVGFSNLILLAAIRALLASNKSLTNAVVADDAHELRMLETSTQPARPALRIPFIDRQRVPDQDDDDILPLGLSG